MGIPQGILRKRKVAVRIVGVAGLTLQGIRHGLQSADPVIAVGRHISQSIGLCCQLADGIIGIFQRISLRCRHREDSALFVIGVCRSTAAGIGHSRQSRQCIISISGGISPAIRHSGQAAAGVIGIMDSVPQRIRTLCQKISCIISVDILSCQVLCAGLADLRDIAVAIVGVCGYGSQRIDRLRESGQMIITISLRGTIRIGDFRDPSVNVTFIGSHVTLSVSSRNHALLHRVIGISLCIAQTVRDGKDPVCSVVSILLYRTLCIRSFRYPVHGIVGILYGLLLRIGLCKAVPVTVIGISQGIAQRIRTGQHPVHGIISKGAGLPLFVGNGCHCACRIIGIDGHCTGGIRLLYYPAQGIVGIGRGPSGGIRDC